MALFDHGQKRKFMDKTIDPKRFGLHFSTRIEQQGDRQFTFRIDRKSRIIMKDGKKILANAGKIKSKVPGAVVTVATTAPVCSKTRQFLADQGISVETG
jgi:predicted AAA+ superfamily ATPase